MLFRSEVLKFTARTLMKLAPKMVTCVPGPPTAGEKLKMAGFTWPERFWAKPARKPQTNAINQGRPHGSADFLAASVVLTRPEFSPAAWDSLITTNCLFMNSRESYTGLPGSKIADDFEFKHRPPGAATVHFVG